MTHQAVPPEIATCILDRLTRIEASSSARVLFSVESGSRAWAMHSPDSDYDVRFIYAHPPDWYWSTQAPRDVIEFMDAEIDLDLSGWELRKAVRLLLKGNPVIQEWLCSSIIYREEPGFREELLSLLRFVDRRPALMHHFLNIARGTYRERIDGRPEVRLKACLYCVRPLLQYLWVRAQPDAFYVSLRLPPISVVDLLDAGLAPPPVADRVKDLLRIKRTVRETDVLPPDAALTAWLSETLATVQPIRRARRLPPEAYQAADVFLTRCISACDPVR